MSKRTRPEESLPEPKRKAPAPQPKECNCKVPEGTPPECPICMELLENKAQPPHLPPRDPNQPGSSTGAPDLGSVVALHCGHVFHHVCVEGWLTKNHAKDKDCPCCRKEIKSKSTWLKVYVSFDRKYGVDPANKCSREDCVKAKKEAADKIKALEEESKLRRDNESFLNKGKSRLVTESLQLRMDMIKKTGKIGHLEDDIKKLEVEKKTWIVKKIDLKRNHRISEDTKQRLEAEIKKLKEENHILKLEAPDLKTATENLNVAKKDMRDIKLALSYENYTLMKALAELNTVSENDTNKRHQLNDRISDKRLLIDQRMETQRYYKERVQRINKLIDVLDPKRYEGCIDLSSDSESD